MSTAQRKRFFETVPGRVGGGRVGGGPKRLMALKPGEERGRERERGEIERQRQEEKDGVSERETFAPPQKTTFGSAQAATGPNSRRRSGIVHFMGQ